MVIADKGSGTAARLAGGVGWRAIWQWTREHLIEGNPQRVEIAAGINRAIHAAGLLWRHVRERAGNDLRRYGGLALLWQLGRNPESGQPYVVGVVNERIRRLDILMYEAVPMDLAECCRQAYRDVQETRQLKRLRLVP